MALSPSDLKPVRQRRYLAKDFDGLRATLLEYARRYYKDRIQDFSEASVGGMFLDLAALGVKLLEDFRDIANLAGL